SNVHAELVGISHKKEFDLHKEFAEFRFKREWFDFSTSPERERELLSYFVEFNDTNEIEIKQKVTSERPEDVKRETPPRRRGLDQEPEVIMIREKKEHPYHTYMKNGGGRSRY